VGRDGNDLDAIDRAIVAAKKETSRPSLIKIRTHIGYGSPNKQDTAEAHGSPLGPEEVALTKERYGWDPAAQFVVPAAAAERMRKPGVEGAALEKTWHAGFEKYAQAHPEQAAEFRRALERRLPDALAARLPAFDPASAMATREAQGKVLDALMPSLPMVLGGSADLTPSNNTRFKGAVDFSRKERTGRYVRYGVREHAMGAILNGIALSDMLIPYGGTFFVFADYMRPAIRVAALSGYPTIFVFTHDSIGLGEDGPTHQPVEQLASLRATPGLTVIRPADATETAAAWMYALTHRDRPVALALSRQKTPVIDRRNFPEAAMLERGAYVLAGPAQPRALIIATGTEVALALQARAVLEAEGIGCRVVSMPSFDLFEAQPASYREEVLPRSVTARVAVEAGVGFGWERYLGTEGVFVGMRSFGASAPAEAAYKGFGITTDAVIAAVRKVLR
jgi:transketolase